MKALVWHGAATVSVDEMPIPTITDPTDVILRVTGTTVCGSDLHLYQKEILQMQDGDILGHEFMGVVDEVGLEVKNFKKGDRVVASFQISCGKCKSCQRGLSSMCDTTNNTAIAGRMYGQKMAGIFGYSHFTGGYAGGQAEYARVPFADYNLLKIPDTVPDEKALFLSDIIPTSYHAVKCAEVKKGDAVAIWGLGPIGLLAARWCQLEGARRVVAIDNVPERLELARTKLGIEVINFSEVSSVVDRLLEMESYGWDCCIDAAAFRYAKGMLHTVERAVGLETDTSEIANECLRAVKKFGNVGLVADYAAFTNHFNIGALMEKGITFRGTGQAPVQHYWQDLLKKLEDGSFDPSFVITHRFDISEFKELYAAFNDKKGGILKTFVQTKHSSPPTPGFPPLSSVKVIAMQ
ncbi:GroES-like protein [Auricularia subglabra TFB-10046 SS5]|nr:GroES-like protein [Auricularia subglabra TFB-10046 SS5]